MTRIAAATGEANLGMLDGACFSCGSPRRRMGWSGDNTNYWLMCTASGADATDTRYGRCNLPTLENALKRVAAEGIKT